MGLVGAVQDRRQYAVDGDGLIAMLAVDLLNVRLGSVTAPAGCGKTHLIAEILKYQPTGKPALVLTHTNAGKAALEARIQKLGVHSRAARVATIDGWAIGLARKFPQRCGLPAQVVNIEDPRRDYVSVRNAVAVMLTAGHLDDVLKATYARLLVDEYQDCGLDQHAIVSAVGKLLNTVVFGDPLQSIFRFGGPTVDWTRHVHASFPPVAELDTPWRWINAGTEALGRWLLFLRPALLARQPIDLSTAPAEVTWCQLTGDDNEMRRQRAAAALTRAETRDGAVLVIAEAANPAGQRQIASTTPGAVAVEALDLRDLTAFGRRFDPRDAESTKMLVEFAAEMMNNLSQAQLLQRVHTHQAGRAKTPPTELEQAVLDYSSAPSLGTAALTLRRLANGPAVRVYRPEALRPCIAALEMAHRGALTFDEAVVRTRERNRHRGRPVRGRSVGSTLLLKGLESEVCVVLYPDGMDVSNLYVALTRGAKKLVVCSRLQVLSPA